VYRVKDWLDRRWFRHLTRRVPGAELSALDIGGGNGQQLSSLRAADPRIRRTVVVDFDEEAEVAARALGHEYVRGRIEDAAVTGPFDVILLLNLIEHVADPLRVLEKARSLLAPTGLLVIKTPNHRSVDASLFRNENWGGYHCPRHWVIFTRASFEQTARKAGLRVVQASYTQGAPFWTVSVLGWLDQRHAVHITIDRPAWMHPMYAPLAALFAGIDFARGAVAPLSQMTFALARA
jgi:SAM-dependent methyltransferase